MSIENEQNVKDIARSLANNETEVVTISSLVVKALTGYNAPERVDEKSVLRFAVNYTVQHRLYESGTPRDHARAAIIQALGHYLGTRAEPESEPSAAPGRS